ncbi:MAG TPA: Fe2+-dependent dioxygenase [Rhizomicrobium sp.]|jgi:PKHD-type hydroxylase|nr:Fe2+-dependent dioxygenase [Rhizomicrobium sp.]
MLPPAGIPGRFPRVSRRKKDAPLFLEQRDFLNPDEVARLSTLAHQIAFIEGRLSNPHNITKVNLQADVADSRHADAARIVFDAFARSREFQDFAMPKKVAPPLLSRYEPGMKYGPHADMAYMSVVHEGVLTSMRSDLSATVFLSDPRSYDGGELVLHIGTCPIVVKGMPGEAFVYPSTLLHEVRPVTSGQRLVSITFIESLVPDERDRNALFELKDILALEGLKMDWVSRVRMAVALENLTRLWSQA